MWFVGGLGAVCRRARCGVGAVSLRCVGGLGAVGGRLGAVQAGSVRCGGVELSVSELLSRRFADGAGSEVISRLGCLVSWLLS